MRCDKCGARMKEEHKDTFFRGPVTIYTCSRCSETFKKFEGNRSLTAILLHDRYGNETLTNRAEPINLH